MIRLNFLASDNSNAYITNNQWEYNHTFSIQILLHFPYRTEFSASFAAMIKSRKEIMTVYISDLVCVLRPDFYWSHRLIRCSSLFTDGLARSLHFQSDLRQQLMGTCDMADFLLPWIEGSANTRNKRPKLRRGKADFNSIWIMFPSSARIEYRFHRSVRSWNNCTDCEVEIVVTVDIYIYVQVKICERW